jgi:hypothetical protein
MTAPITLPGDIPGLLRRGSPVRLDRLPAWGGTLPVGAPGVVLEPEEMNRALVAWFSHQVESVHQANIALDLADPTGRAHAAWWVAPLLAARTPNNAGDLYRHQSALALLRHAQRGPGWEPLAGEVDELRDLCLRLVTPAAEPESSFVPCPTDASLPAADCEYCSHGSCTDCGEPLNRCECERA